MTLDDVIDLLKWEYEKAVTSEWVQKPLSYALYQTWEAINEKEKRRKRSENNAE